MGGTTWVQMTLFSPAKMNQKGGHSRVWIKVYKHDWCEFTVLLHTDNSLQSLLSLYVCRLPPCLVLVWKWISPIHHHCAWSAVTRVMPFMKLKWDHGNIQLCLCSCQSRSYRCNGYLCQKGRFTTPNTAWKHTVINLHGSLAYILTYSTSYSRGYNDTLIYD